jgi:hypothetical protein
VAQVGEHLSSKCEALSLNPSTTTTTKKKKKKCRSAALRHLKHPEVGGNLCLKCLVTGHPHSALALSYRPGYFCLSLELSFSLGAEPQFSKGGFSTWSHFVLLCAGR